MRNKSTKPYQTPTIKVVRFMVESGYDLSGDRHNPTTTFMFGGNDARGGIHPGQENDHSGLNRYGDGGNIFGETL